MKNEQKGLKQGFFFVCVCVCVEHEREFSSLETAQREWSPLTKPLQKEKKKSSFAFFNLLTP